MAFVDLEARLNLAARARLSNASATWWPGGVGVGVPLEGLRVLFDRSFDDVAGGVVNDANPVASVLEVDVLGIGRDHALRITRDGEALARDYRVTKATPDGTGWVQVQLQELGA